MKNCIIAINREYGSGGRDVGWLLAKELELPVFDDELIHMATEKSGMCVDTISKRDEKVKNNFLQNLRRLSISMPVMRLPSGYTSYAMAMAAARQRSVTKLDDDILFDAQANVIREIAMSGGCIIVGRCAGYILQDNPNLISVFIRGNFDDRVRRTIETYNMPEKNAVNNVKKVDKYRSNHYKYYTSREWGASANYDMVINTSCTGIEGAVAAIKGMVNAKK